MKTRIYQSRRAVTRRLRRRSAWRKKIAAVAGITAVIYVCSVTIFVPTYAISGTSVFRHTSSNPVSVNWPNVHQAALGAKGYGVLESYGSTKPIPSASTIKLVTALAVLQKKPLGPNEQGPTITIKQSDVAIYNWYVAHNGSSMPVYAGQKLSQRQALEAVLLRSANNVADSLVRWAFGSHEAYRAFAQQYVESLGMPNTTIGSDASGLNPSSTTTAIDLVRLGEVAMQHPVVSDIVGQRTARIPDVGTIRNSNNLLGTHGIVGVKTGTDTDNKGKYVFASRYSSEGSEPLVIIGAVMSRGGISQAKSEGLTLLLDAKKHFAPRTIIKKGEVLGHYTAPWTSKKIEAVAATDARILGWHGTPAKLQISLEDIDAPVERGATIGTITDTNSDQVGTVTLTESVPAPSLLWRLTHPLQTWRLQAE